jgi:hypothetical protein
MRAYSSAGVGCKAYIGFTTTDHFIALGREVFGSTVHAPADAVTIRIALNTPHFQNRTAHILVHISIHLQLRFGKSMEQ